MLNATFGTYMESYREMQKMIRKWEATPPNVYGAYLQKHSTRKGGKTHGKKGKKSC